MSLAWSRAAAVDKTGVRTRKRQSQSSCFLQKVLDHAMLGTATSLGATSKSHLLQRFGKRLIDGHLALHTYTRNLKHEQSGGAAAFLFVPQMVADKLHRCSCTF